jgi:hypothetical protein
MTPLGIPRQLISRVLVIAALLLAGPALTLANDVAPASDGAASAAPVPGVAWSALSAEQQRLLARFQGNWAALPIHRQQALARGASRWLSMSPEQRDGVKTRFRQFGAMNDEERRVLRQRWQQFQQLTPAEQEAVRRGFTRFRDLPPERRQELREHWRKIPADERRRILQRVRERRRARPIGP